MQFGTATRVVEHLVPFPLTSGHRAVERKRGHMVRFQLVFQTADGERSEIRDNNAVGEPHIEAR